MLKNDCTRYFTVFVNYKHKHFEFHKMHYTLIYYCFALFYYENWLVKAVKFISTEQDIDKVGAFECERARLKKPLLINDTLNGLVNIPYQ